MDLSIRHLKRKTRAKSSQGRLQGVEPLEEKRLLAAQLVINEVMYNPLSGQNDEEWIELFNAGDEAINLGGHRIDGGIDFEFPNLDIPAGEFLVVAANTDNFHALYPDVQRVVGGWNGRLGNRSDRLLIRSPDGDELTRARYADSGDWANRRVEFHIGAWGWTWVAPHDGEGSSLELANPAMPGDVGQNWLTSAQIGGTPGEVNHAASTNIAPAIVDVGHVPIIPTSGDSVSVSARVIDERPGVQVTLYYRESQLLSRPFETVPMFDDGQHGDGAVGDQVYGATIPPFTQDAVIEFYVHSVDTTGLVRTSPAPTDETGRQDANYLYQVDDVVRPNDIPLYRTVMTVGDRARFTDQLRASDSQANATFIATVSGVTEARYNVGVRHRGSGSRVANPPNNRINIPGDRPWNGATRLNINSGFPMAQISGAALFNLAGLPVADAIPVRRLDNNVDLASGRFYAHVEVLDGSWAAKHFPNDSQGNVYRGRRAGSESPPGGRGAGLVYQGEDPLPYVSYLKMTNRSEADYTDVIRLTDALNNAPDDVYLEEVAKHVNIEQWVRTIAVIDLTGYSEAGLLLGDGGGDDYAMYRGVEDPRFVFVPYDMDSMYSQGGTLLLARGVRALKRLLDHPEVRALYYEQVYDLMEGVFSPERLENVLGQMLTGVASQARINSILRYFQTRYRSVRKQVPTEMTVTATDEVIDARYHTDQPITGTLSGTANALTTRRVVINGQPAEWDFRTGKWTVTGIALEPGSNQLTVQSFDSAGQSTDSLTVNYWRKIEGPGTTVDGDLGMETRWTKADSPVRLSGTVVVPENGILTVEAGTQLEFGSNASLVVRGQLVVQGSTDDPVWLTRTPGRRRTWSGIRFDHSAKQNRIQHAVIQFAESSEGAIRLVESQLDVESVIFADSSRRRIHAIDSSLSVRNSEFSSTSTPEEAPETVDASGHIWAQGTKPGGFWVVANNEFGYTGGSNVAVDFRSSQTHAVIPVIRDNRFLGGGGHALRIVGDARVEGNRFSHYTRDSFGNAGATAGAIHARGGTIDAERNFFHDVETSFDLEEGTFLNSLHNTIRGTREGAIVLRGSGNGSPAAGAHLEATIIDDDVAFVKEQDGTEITMSHSLTRMPVSVNGIGNVVGRADLDQGLSIREGSPAIGIASAGLNAGADVHAGASISEMPALRTSLNQVALRVGGVGVTNYRFRLNQGDWSAPMSVDRPLELTGLADGTYVIQVIGQNQFGEWQSEDKPFVGREWTVDSTLTGLRINEIMADNRGSVLYEGMTSDLIEIRNNGRHTVDLGGMSISDDSSQPDKFVFPVGTMIEGNGYLVLVAGEEDDGGGIHLGFALDADGEAVYLYDVDGQLMDQVEFGIQPADFSLGRNSAGVWGATDPTFGEDNRPRAEGARNRLRINEWMADARVTVNDDFIEIYNPSLGPVDLGGMYLTDNIAGWPDRFEVPALTYVGPERHLVFFADGNPDAGKDHVSFGLSRTIDTVSLADEQMRQVDGVRFWAQLPDVASGLVEDGAYLQSPQHLPTPGLSNQAGSVQASQLDQFRNLRISEIHFNPAQNEDLEFIELVNIGDAPLDLTGVRISEAIVFEFPSLVIDSGERVVVVKNEFAFRGRYGETVLIAGEFERSLSNGGELLSLELPSPSSTRILSFTYDDAWYPQADGEGFSLVVVDELAQQEAWEDAASWNSSDFVGGSPGFAEVDLSAKLFGIHEVAKVDGGSYVELINETQHTLDLSGWYLSDDSEDLAKFRIPSETHLRANQQIGFTNAHFGDEIAISDAGGWITLSSPDASEATASVVVSQPYDSSMPGGSLGRHVLSTGEIDFTELREPTFDLESANAPPRVGPVVISEIAYAPRDGIEYVEIYNASDADIVLFAGDDPTRPWALRGAVNYDFPAGVTLPANGYVVIVGTDPQVVRQVREIPEGVQVLGPFNGILDDDGDDVQLVSYHPETHVEYLVDRVAYSNQAPWSLKSILGDETLNRVSATVYGNDPANWEFGIAGGTPGRANLPADESRPTVPGNLTARINSDSTVRLSWDPAQDTETGVVAYRVFRDDVLIGETPELEFLDNRAPIGNVSYRVRAVSGQGIEGFLSSRLRLGLFGANVRSIATTQVLVEFDTTVRKASAENPENYVLGAGEISLKVHQATLLGDGRTVSLITDSLEIERVYTLEIRQVGSTNSLQLPPNYQTRFVRQQAIPGVVVIGRSTARARVSKLSDIDPLLQLPADDPAVGRTNRGIYPNINFFDDDNHDPTGIIDGDVRFPTDTPGGDNNLVIDASGYVLVDESQAGPWTFAANLHGSRTVPFDVTIIERGSSWRYLDDGTDQRTAWRDRDFDDSGWPIGQATFGYGNGDESTLVDFGNDEQNKHVTTYFRNSFQISDPSTISKVTARLIRDDGAAVYLNGTEVSRRNLVFGATYDTFANSEIADFFEKAPVTFSIDPGLFVAGTNVMAVETHQSSSSGQDLAFDFELLVTLDGQYSLDGAMLSIDGNRVIVADQGNNDSDRMATVDLAAGAHPLHFQAFEWSGGAEVELVAAPGAFQALGQTDRWQLVGDPGWLKLVTDPPSANLVVDMIPVRPYGAGIEQGVVVGQLSGQSIPLRYELSLSQGTPVSVVAHPENENGTLEIRIRDTLQTLAAAQSSRAGGSAVVQNFETPADGQYLLEVVSKNAMPVTLHVVANAYSETEESDTSSNDRISLAERIPQVARDEVAGIVRHRVSGAIDEESLVDFFMVRLEAGAIVTVTVATEGVARGSRLDLLGSDAQPLAVGIRTEDSLQIRDFPIAESGDFYFAVSASESVNYTLSVITGASNVGASNSSIENATSVSLTGQQLGLLAGVAGRRPDVGSGISPANPTVLFDAEGFWWDLEDGWIRDGTRDAFDGGFETVPFDMRSARFEDADREVLMGPVANSDGATLSRKFFVSPDAGFSRFLEIVENKTSAPITTTVSIRSDLGANDQIKVLQTSDEDAIVTSQDAWFVLNDNRGGEIDPVVLHTVYGERAREFPERSWLVQDRLTTEFVLDLVPGETKILMHFVAQTGDRDQALRMAEWLAGLPSESISGLSSSEAEAVVNFTVPVNSAWYDLPLAAGQTTKITADPVKSDGDLKVRLSAFGPDGQSLGSAESILDVAAVESGSHRVLAQAIQGSGDFVLVTTPSNMVRPFRVVDISPASTAVLRQTPSSIEIHTTAAALVDDLGGVQLNAVPALGAEWVDGDTVRFLFDPQVVPETEQLEFTVSSTALTDYNGRLVEPVNVIYEIDSIAPQITTRELLGLAHVTRPTGAFGFQVEFSESVLLEDDAVWLQDSVTGIRLVLPSMVSEGDFNQWEIEFDHVPEGDYLLVISDQITDHAGNRLDAELGPSGGLGDGRSGGSLSLPIRFDTPTVDLKERLNGHSTRLANSLTATIIGAIDHDNDIDSFTLDLIPGETFDVQLKSLTDGPEVHVEVRDPWARAIGAASTNSSSDVIRVGPSNAVAGGRFRVDISGARDAGFELQVATNTALEPRDATLERPVPMSTWSLGPYGQHSAVSGRLIGEDSDYFLVDAGHLVGEFLDVAVASPNSDGAIEILDPHDQTVLAASEVWNEQSSVPVVLRDIAVPTDGMLLVRLNLQEDGDYQVIASSTSLEAESDRLGLGERAVRGSLGTIGEGVVDERDVYDFEAMAGQTVLWEAQAVGEQGGDGSLGLALELLNEAGETLVTSQSSSLGLEDGRRVELMYHTMSNEQLTVSVQRQSGVGVYELQTTDVGENPVVGRFLFQNNSVADGKHHLAGPSDIHAVMSDKTALRPGELARPANYTASPQGLNGLLVDLVGVTRPLNAEDFNFRVGRGAELENWIAAPQPSQVLHRPGAGVGGADRIHIIWGDHEIENTWLEVTVFANNYTGLTEPDVFYFGNLIGDTGDHVGRFEVNSIDLLGVRNHLEAAYPAAMMFDLTGDGVIGPPDKTLVADAQGEKLEPPFGAASEFEFPSYGDTNLDGVFNMFDLQLVNFDEYEDEFANNSTWREGDWDGDGDFTSLDLVFAFQQGRFDF